MTKLKSSTQLPILSCPAVADHGVRPARPLASAANMLTVYLVLLLAIPSNLSVGPLGSLGKPALLWGIALAVWWIAHQLQRSTSVPKRVWQPVRYMFMTFLVVVLVSFAAALFRGQPPDQVSPAFTGVLRVVSWGGVILVAMDGIRTRDDLCAMIRRLTVGGGLVAAFGLAQFLSGRTLLNWLHGVPGVNFDSGELIARGAFLRPSATATHPLEYAVVVTGCLPLALITAISDGFQQEGNRRIHIRWWLPVALMAISSLLSVSRSGIIGLVVAIIATLPAMPRSYRRAVIAASPAVAIGVAAVVPGMFSTMLVLFTGTGDDPSTQSRSNALARLPEFVAPSPIIGQGFGTFLPRYYIFDNEWALLTIEAGVLGVMAFAAIALAGIGASIWSTRGSRASEIIMLGRGLAAAIVTVVVLFAFFDALSFPMSGGMYVLFTGLAAALQNIIGRAAIPLPPNMGQERIRSEVPRWE